MQIAFQATLKPPDHPVPSGDRLMARLLMSALDRIGDVRVASRFVSRSRSPDPAHLTAIRSAALAEADKLIKAYTDGSWRPDVWLTYHLYYKAPDWIGATVSAALGIPYVVAEASYAGKRDRDAWAPWQADAVTQMRAADLIFCFSQLDRVGLAKVVAPDRLRDLAPFLDTKAFDRSAERSLRREGPVQLVTVAMMRHDAKLESYRHIAGALQQLSPHHWHWHVVGDGAAEADVRAASASLDPARITWHGRLESVDVRRVLREADVFVWPGVREGFGMAYLEAQALGLPVVAFRTGGVPAVVRHGETGLLVDDQTADAFAGALYRLIADPDLRARMGRAARHFVLRERSLVHASNVIAEGLAAAASHHQLRLCRRPGA
ncbi:MAG: glycosyltransferase family 4 protein [Pseudomonadota bacterium]